MFNVGDRVQAIVHHPSNSSVICIGDQGTVCYPEFGEMISVKWDQKVNGHDCWGSCEPGYGWRVMSHEISLVEEELDFEIEDNAFMEVLKNA